MRLITALLSESCSRIEWLRTLGRGSETRATIARVYAGPMTFADDRDCFN
jgi:hypothetical protein